jgi:hypothetical protein
VTDVRAGSPGRTAGAFGQITTYLPGNRVRGVRFADDRVEVHVVGWYGPNVEDLAGEARAAVARHTAGGPIDVVVEDVDVRTEQAEPEPAPQDL